VGSAPETNYRPAVTDHRHPTTVTGHRHTRTTQSAALES
jgi:hypothetical protein